MKPKKEKLKDQEKLKDFINNNIIACQSYLVDEMLKKEIFSYDDIVNLCLTDEQLKKYYGYEGKGEIEEARYRGEDMQEIFEWWLCDDWMLEKLEERGEPILKTDFGSWWGRTCTGQAILLDSVIENIYNSL